VETFPQELRNLKKLRNRFERFCYRNRDFGIPNLMLFITLANAVVYVMSIFDGSNILFQVLCFNRTAILHGQIWRLVTFVFTSVFAYGNAAFVVIGLICYYTLGRAIEKTWGTLRFNLFYLTGILLMDLFAMIFGGLTFNYAGFTLTADVFYLNMGSSLNLSLFIAYATLYPNSQFLLFYIIPVRAWIFSLLYLGITLYEIIRYTFELNAFPHSLISLVALLNYFLFFGKDVLNVFPFLNRRRVPKVKTQKPKQSVQYKTVPFPQKADFNHRCTVCGRTDVTDPELEFRYCSRCNGYYCYCEEHISSHTHVQ
jgi:membrane associated rhomboid family serine protease